MYKKYCTNPSYDCKNKCSYDYNKCNCNKCNCNHNKCGCNDYTYKCYCKCTCKCDRPSDELLIELGKYFYNILEKVDLPPGHPNLNDSIKCALCNCLPPGHPSLLELACSTLKKHC